MTDRPNYSVLYLPILNWLVTDMTSLNRITVRLDVVFIFLPAAD